MVIQEDLLITFGAQIIKLEKNEVLFKEDNFPAYYFQIRKGKMKLTNLKVGGGEFIQSLHQDGEAVGEIFLFSDRSYPLNAVSMEACTILKLEQIKFFKLLKTDFKIQLKFLQYIAERMRFSYIILNSLTSDDPTSKLLNLLNYMKDNQNQSECYAYKIPYTRKEIASLTGLRIETVIRTFKKMESEQIVKIIKGKIFY